MRRGLISSYLSSIFSSKKNVAIIIIIILIVVGGFLAVMALTTPNVKIQPLSKSVGHFVHPYGQTGNDYYEYRVYANITGLPDDGKGYYCVCSFYDKQSGAVLGQSNVKLDNYSYKDYNTVPCGVFRYHTFHQLSKVEISVFNATGCLVSFDTYNWNNNVTSLIRF